MEDEKSEVLLALFQWNAHHDPVDFEILHSALFPLITRHLERYPKEIKPKLEAYAMGIFLWALATYNSKGLPSLEAFVASAARRIGRKAGHLMYPGVPESQWSRQKAVKKP
jgi:hypothetical protein